MKTYDILAFSQAYSTAPRAMYVELVYGFYSLFLVYSLNVVQVYGFYAVYANDELVCSILVWKTYMVPRGTTMVQETTKTNAYVRPITRSSPCGVKKRGLCDPLDLTVSSPNHKSKKMKGNKSEGNKTSVAQNQPIIDSGKITNSPTPSLSELYNTDISVLDHAEEGLFSVASSLANTPVKTSKAPVNNSYTGSARRQSSTSMKSPPTPRTEDVLHESAVSQTNSKRIAPLYLPINEKITRTHAAAELGRRNVKVDSQNIDDMVRQMKADRSSVMDYASAYIEKKSSGLLFGT